MTRRSSSASTSAPGSRCAVPSPGAGRVSRRRLLVGGLAAALLRPGHPAAAAEGPPILVVSRQRLLTETEQARRLNEAELRLGSELQKRIDRVKAELSAEEAELARQRGSLDRESFEARVSEFDRRVRAERRLAQQFGANLRNAFRAERLKLIRAIGPILDEILAERGALVIIERDTVLAADPSVDVTDEAIARFNASVPMPEIPTLESLAPAAETGSGAQ